MSERSEVDRAAPTDALPPDPAVADPAQPPPARGRLDPVREVAGRLGQDRRVDLALRIAGGLLAAALAAATAAEEAFYAPLAYHWTSGGQAHWTRVPVALLAALLINPLLAWYAYRTTRRLAGVAAPAVAWIAVMLAAAMKTTEGDLVLAANNWVGIATVFGGALAFAAGVMVLSYRTLPARQF